MQRLLLGMAIMLMMSACEDTKKRMPMSALLIEEARQANVKCPYAMAEGVMFVSAVYEDTLFTITIEVDENEIPFENIVSYKEGGRQSFMAAVQMSEGDRRKEYEEYVKHHVTHRFVFQGKKSHKRMITDISPQEIEQALKHQISSRDFLEQRIDAENEALPREDSEGLVVTRLQLLDSVLVVNFEADAELYDYQTLAGNKGELKDNLRSLLLGNKPFYETFHEIAKLKMGMTYRFAVNGQRLDIVFTPNEIQYIDVYIQSAIKTSKEIE